MLGYGIFWSIVEELYNNGNKMQINYKGMAKDYHTKPEIIQSIIENFDLFVKDNENFGSKSIEKRINERDVKSKKATISAFYRWGKDANAMREELGRNAINKGKEIKGNKGKEIKGNESKVNKEDDSYCFNISDTILRISEMPTWKEQIQRVFKISVDQTENYLTIFFDELLLKGETVRSINDTKSHFVNWLKIQLDKKGKSNKSTIQKEPIPEELLQYSEEEREEIMSGRKLYPEAK